MKIEAKIIFKRLKLKFVEKTEIFNLFDLLINKKKLIHEENEVDIANPITPYIGNKNMPNIIFTAIAIKLYLKGFSVSPRE
jgi:hypothetical protein